MPKQYIIENGAENNRWLYKIERRGTPEQVNCFHPIIEDAVIFQKKEEAVVQTEKQTVSLYVAGVGADFGVFQISLIEFCNHGNQGYGRFNRRGNRDRF